MDKKTKTTISFSSFSEQKAINMFNLSPQLEGEMLDVWFNRTKNIDVTENELERLRELLAKSRIFIRGWNEDELKWKFLGPIIELVNFDNFELKIGAFSERPLSLKVNNIEIKGIVDLVIAFGTFAPEQPFFFIQEFKKEQDSNGDAVGQLLAAMSIAQELNKAPKPISLFEIETKTYVNIPLYGSYVIGRFWFFLKLEGTKYQISKAYDSLDEEELIEIFKILKAQKEIMLEFISK